MSVSFFGAITLTTEVASLYLTNQETNRYRPPALKLKKTSGFYQSQVICIIHTIDPSRQESTETVNSLIERIIKQPLESGENMLISDFRKLYVINKRTFRLEPGIRE